MQQSTFHQYSSAMEIYQKKRAIFAYLVHKYYILGKKRKRTWVNPYIDTRLITNDFSTIFSELRENPDKFFDYFRMTVKTFDELAEKISPKIKSLDTYMRLAVPPSKMLAVTLRYLGSGCDWHQLHLMFKIGHSTISIVVRKVCNAIWECLQTESFPKFTQERWKEISEGFQQRTQFPNCLGAIGGKHVRIRKPRESESSFYHFKKNFSIVMFAIVDSDCKFIYVDIGAFGKDADNKLYENVPFYAKLIKNELNIPTSQPLPGTVSPEVPYVFIGDETFPLSLKITKPYTGLGGKNFSDKQMVFNNRLLHARRCFESGYSILSDKWKVFSKPINVNLDLCTLIVKACCVLHNFVLSREGSDVHDVTNTEGLLNIKKGKTRMRAAKESICVRNNLADYFVSDIGRVS